MGLSSDIQKCLQLLPHESIGFVGDHIQYRNSKLYENNIINHLNNTIINHNNEIITEENIASNVATPDILLKNTVWINDNEVNWIEIKRYFVTMNGQRFMQKLEKTVQKYHDNYGKGAVICCGFEHEVTQKFDNCSFLDGSCFI